MGLRGVGARRRTGCTQPRARQFEPLDGPVHRLHGASAAAWIEDAEMAKSQRGQSQRIPHLLASSCASFSALALASASSAAFLPETPRPRSPRPTRQHALARGRHPHDSQNTANSTHAKTTSRHDTRMHSQTTRARAPRTRGEAHDTTPISERVAGCALRGREAPVAIKRKATAGPEEPVVRACYMHRVESPSACAWCTG